MLHQPASTFEPSQPVPPKNRPTNEAIGHAARNWEAEICDLADLADVAATIVDASLCHSGETITLTRQEIRRILFCVYELSKLTEQFKDAYYAAIEPEA